MDAANNLGAGPAGARTSVERASELELVATRTFDAPPRIVWQAWTRPDLLKRWWAPKSMGMTLISCETDVRTGGSYRFEIGHPAADQPVPFFGKYIEVVPPSRLVWTNEETEDGAVTTVTLEEKDGKTLLTLRERYTTKEALERNAGGVEGLPEQFAQLDEVLGELA